MEDLRRELRETYVKLYLSAEKYVRSEITLDEYDVQVKLAEARLRDFLVKVKERR